MRTAAVAVGLLLLYVTPVRAQQKQPTKARHCTAQSAQVPDSYLEAVHDLIQPPQWQASVVRISVSPRLWLWTDGRDYKIWIGKSSIEKVLYDLAMACKLPPDPGDAARLVKMDWANQELSPAQFAEIHQGLFDALATYLSSTQNNSATVMRTKMQSLHSDFVHYRVSYDNSVEHIEVRVWDGLGQQDDKPMLDWIHALRQRAPDAFYPWVREIKPAR